MQMRSVDANNNQVENNKLLWHKLPEEAESQMNRKRLSFIGRQDGWEEREQQAKHP